ncbi:MAG: histidine phosphatase family protein [Nitrospirae bacterium]|nr:histidine phosphatase family protein [Nitrospirota bacterium]
MATTLYLIRHGETEGSETKRYKGSIDVPLSEKGIRQMEQVAKYLSQNIVTPTHPSPSRGEGKGGGENHSNKLNAVYCSNLSRAIKSAEIIAKPYNLNPIQMKDLRERSFGIWEGMSFTEIKEKYPQEFEAWATNPLRYSPMGGESTLEVRDRVINVLDKIISDQIHKGHDRIQDTGCKMQDEKNHESCIMNHAFSSNIAIVSHGGVNRIILCHILGIPLENIFRIEQDYAAVNIIEFWDKYPVVKLLNGGIELK